MYKMLITGLGLLNLLDEYQSLLIEKSQMFPFAFREPPFFLLPILPIFFVSSLSVIRPLGSLNPGLHPPGTASSIHVTSCSSRKGTCSIL